MARLTELQAEIDIRALLSYLLENQKRTIEPVVDACERYTVSTNAYFDADAFSVSVHSRDSLRVACACGWSLNLTLSGDAMPETASPLLTECLRRMIFHYELQHSGLKQAEVPR
jgi:hypothetical protein